MLCVLLRSMSLARGQGDGDAPEPRDGIGLSHDVLRAVSNDAERDRPRD